MDTVEASLTRMSLFSERNNDGPFISVYLDTRSENGASARARLDQIVSEIQLRLKDMAEDKREDLVSPLRSLDVSLTGPRQRIAIFRSRKVLHVLPVFGGVSDFFVVSDSFHLKPLLVDIQMDGRLYVLLIKDEQIEVYESSLEGLSLSSIYFLAAAKRAVRAQAMAASERARPKLHLVRVNPRLSKNYALRVLHRTVQDKYRRLLSTKSARLICAGPPEVVDAFIVQCPIGSLKLPLQGGAPALVDRQALYEAARRLFDASVHRHGVKRSRAYNAMVLRVLVTENLEQAAFQAATGRLQTLFLAKGSRLDGSIDRVSGKVEFDDGSRRGAEDIYDDLAELTLANGGSVFELSSDEMPSGMSLVAFLRDRRKESWVKERAEDRRVASVPGP